MNRTVSIPVTIVIVGVATLAGCSKSPKTKAAEASVSASAHALAHNKKVQAAEKAWKPVVEDCAKGQHWLTHPIKSIETLYTCTTKNLTPTQRAKVKTCFENAAKHNGLHHAEAADISSATLCLAQYASKPKVTK